MFIILGTVSFKNSRISNRIKTKDLEGVIELQLAL